MITTIFFKILPLYSIIVLGFLGGKLFKLENRPLSTLLIYLIVPFVIFKGIISRTFVYDLLFLPLLFFAIQLGLALLSRLFSKGHERPIRGLLCFTAAAGNTGYFGIPVALALFGPQALAIAVLCVLGNVLYENSAGVYFLARGHHTHKESLKKLFTLPSLYALIAGLLCKWWSVPFSESTFEYLSLFQGAYTIVGMMIIGITLAHTHLGELNRFFLFYSLLSKFLLWPILMVLFILSDQHFFHLYTATPIVYGVLLLMSAVPIAANSVAFATLLNVRPHEASIAVIISTLITLIILPLIFVLAPMISADLPTILGSTPNPI